MNHYEILGIHRDATPEEIKAAYRSKAKQYHPDVNKTKDAEQKFKLVQEAYETLSNTAKRVQYNHKTPPSKPRRPKTKDEFQEDQRQQELAKIPLTEVTRFGNINLMCQIHLTESELRSGTNQRIKITKKGICPKCWGYGDGFPAICPACSGTGNTMKIHRRGGNSHMILPACPACDGTGNIEKGCMACGGTGQTNVMPNLVTFKTPANAKVGQMIIVRGEGEKRPDTMPGNLHVVLLKK